MIYIYIYIYMYISSLPVPLDIFMFRQRAIKDLLKKNIPQSCICYSNA